MDVTSSSKILFRLVNYRRVKRSDALKVTLLSTTCRQQKKNQTDPQAFIDVLASLLQSRLGDASKSCLWTNRNATAHIEYADLIYNSASITDSSTGSQKESGSTADRQKDEQAGRQTGRQADRQARCILYIDIGGTDSLLLDLLHENPAGQKTWTSRSYIATDDACASYFSLCLQFLRQSNGCLKLTQFASCYCFLYSQHLDVNALHRHQSESTSGGLQVTDTAVIQPTFYPAKQEF